MVDEKENKTNDALSDLMNVGNGETDEQTPPIESENESQEKNDETTEVDSGNDSNKETEDDSTEDLSNDSEEESEDEKSTEDLPEFNEENVEEKPTFKEMATALKKYLKEDRFASQLNLKIDEKADGSFKVYQGSPASMFMIGYATGKCIFPRTSFLRGIQRLGEDHILSRYFKGKQF